MAASGDPGDADSRPRVVAGLANLCRELAQLRVDLADDGADPGTPLQSLLNAVTSGQASPRDLVRLLDTVHAAVVRATGDNWGIYGNLERYGGQAAGIRNMEIVYRCPLGQCAGRLRDEVKTFPPTCEIAEGRELIRERLS